MYKNIQVNKDIPAKLLNIGASIPNQHNMVLRI